MSGFDVYRTLVKAELRTAVVPECQLTLPVLQTEQRVP